MPLVALFKVDGTKEVRQIARGLRPLQEAVEGRIEMPGLAYGLDLVCNEDAIAEGLEPNLTTHLGNIRIADQILCPDGEHIFGNFLVVRCNSDGDLTDLTDDDLRVIGCK